MQKPAQLKICDLTIENVSIGILAHEKTQPQPLIITLAVTIDISKAVITDNFAETVDYTKLAEHMKTLCHSKHFDLLETLCETLSDSLFKHFPITALDLEIRKPRAIPQAMVSVRIQRP